MSRVRVTIRDVAKDAQVSTSTVSRYINDSGYVDASTAKRISEAIERTKYQPSILARGLKMKHSNIVLLVVPDICNPFYSTMAQTIQELLAQKGFYMALYDSHNGDNELSAISLARQINASGIMLGAIDINQSVIDAISESAILTIGINSYQDCPFDSVHVDGSMGTYLACRYLLSLGHKRIGFAGGTPMTLIGESRKNGFLQAMQEAGIPVEMRLIKERGFSQQDGFSIGCEFLEQSEQPTAICCANDLVAFGVMNAYSSQGYNVPNDISVTGMDDIPYARLSSPSLTSVTNDAVLFSRESVKMFLDRFESKYKGEVRSVAIAHKLVKRESCRSPKALT